MVPRMVPGMIPRMISGLYMTCGANYGMGVTGSEDATALTPWFRYREAGQRRAGVLRWEWELGLEKKFGATSWVG